MYYKSWHSRELNPGHAGCLFVPCLATKTSEYQFGYHSSSSFTFNACHRLCVFVVFMHTSVCSANGRLWWYWASVQRMVMMLYRLCFSCWCLLIGEGRDIKQRAGGRGAWECLEAEVVSLSVFIWTLLSVSHTQLVSVSFIVGSETVKILLCGCRSCLLLWQREERWRRSWWRTAQLQNKDRSVHSLFAYSVSFWTVLIDSCTQCSQMIF